MNFDESFQRAMKAAEKATGHHVHTDACKNRWGTLLCSPSITPMVSGVRPVKKGSVVYMLGLPRYDQSTEPGKKLFSGVAVMRNGKEVGTLYYSPDSYPSTPWQASMSKLRFTFVGNKEPDPFRDGPAVSAHDFHVTTPQAALEEFARRGEARIAWVKKSKRSDKETATKTKPEKDRR